MAVFRSDENETSGLDLMQAVATSFGGADLIVVACTETYGRKTNELYSTFQELQFIKTKKTAAQLLYIRMFPFEQPYVEDSAQFMLAGVLYGAVWMRGASMPG